MTVELNHRFDGPEEAPVLALSNSLGTTPAMWEEQLPALTERFRVLRYDHRGHGESPVPTGPYSMADLGGDLLALLDRLELGRVSLCGVSLGGMVSMWVAGEQPERIDRLVLCSTSATLGPPELWQERIAAVRSRGTEALADATIERWLTPEFRAAHPGRAGSLRAAVATTPDEGYASACEAIRDMDLRERLPRIDAPTLVIGASDDPSTPPEPHATLIANSIPGARLVVIDGARHLVNVERPDEVNPLLLEHLG